MPFNLPRFHFIDFMILEPSVLVTALGKNVPAGAASMWMSSGMVSATPD